ncbi:MAG TPA: PQQ-dependent sugar dehydrogenase [Candidatus Acidoferrum sp.]|nr:PQQ-dependent sugar dehydrogenase [Candidatus Acidoferrum sp.]
MPHLPFTARRSPILTCLLTLTLTGLVAAGAAQAQQNVPFANGIPVAPTGLANIKLGAGPWTYPTGEGMDIKVEVVARDIEYPMAMAFTPKGELLLVTRKGKLFSIANGKATEIPGGPPSVFAGESGGVGTVHGYVDIVLHPDFAKNQLVYISYTKPVAGSPRGSIAIGRGKLVNGKLEGFADIYDTQGKGAGVARMAFDKAGKLYVAPSGSDPQDLNTIGGKVLRLNDDGSIPKDNPYVGVPNTKPEVYSWGHRSALGLAMHPGTGMIWESENGPNGGDEINIIKPKANYGWPKVSLGRDYKGPWQSADGPTHAGYEQPIVYWMPAIAVSGLLFYTGDALPKWKGDVFVGSLRNGEVNGTGHIERILMNDKFEELRRERLLDDLHQRVRDLKQGPDGYIYLCTEQKDGAVLRIMPAK